MKSLVYLTVVLLAFFMSGCNSYDENQQFFDEVEQALEAESDGQHFKNTNSGENKGSNPH